MLAEDKRGRSNNNFLLSRENALATLMSSIIILLKGCME